MSKLKVKSTFTKVTILLVLVFLDWIGLNRAMELISSPSDIALFCGFILIGVVISTLYLAYRWWGEEDMK